MSDNGLEKVPGIFISRLVQGGLAEMTGLLAVNDEVLEVNSIEVNGKSLDQVEYTFSVCKIHSVEYFLYIQFLFSLNVDSCQT